MALLALPGLFQAAVFTDTPTIGPSFTATPTPPPACPILYDNESGGVNTGTTLNFMHSVGVGPNSALVLQVAISGSSAAVISATVGGQPLTMAIRQPVAGSWFETWFIASPPTGPQTVVITLDSTADVAAHSTTFFNLDPVNPIRNNWVNTFNGDPVLPAFTSDEPNSVLLAQAIWTTSGQWTGMAGGEILMLPFDSAPLHSRLGRKQLGLPGPDVVTMDFDAPLSGLLSLVELKPSGCLATPTPSPTPTPPPPCPPAFDTFQNGSGASSLAFPHTVNAGPDSIFVLQVAIASVSVSVTTATIAGQPLTYGYRVVEPGSGISFDVWYKLNPPVGASQSVFAALGGAASAVGKSYTFFGIDQVTPLLQSVAQGFSSTDNPVHPFSNFASDGVALGLLAWNSGAATVSGMGPGQVGTGALSFSALYTQGSYRPLGGAGGWSLSYNFASGLHTGASNVVELKRAGCTTPTPTFSPTPAASPSFTPTATMMPSFTFTPTATQTSTPLPSFTFTPTATRTNTPLPSFTHSPTVSPSGTPTRTATLSASPTGTSTRTASPTGTATATHTPSPTPSHTPLGSFTHTPTRTATPSASPTRTATRSSTATLTPLPFSPTFSPTRTRTSTPSPSQTRTASPTRTVTPPACAILQVAASLGTVQGVALDRQGNLYVASATKHQILKFNYAGAAAAYAGVNGTPGYTDVNRATALLNAPWGLVLDGGDHVYFSDNANHVVRRIDAITGMVSTIAGTGSNGALVALSASATSLDLSSPKGLAIDSAGNLYIADSGHNCIRKVLPGGIMQTLTLTVGALNAPAGLAVDDLGDLYIADSGNRQVRSYSSLGVLSVVAGTGALGDGGDGSPATAATFNTPMGLAFAGDGKLYVSDSGSHRIREITLGSNIQAKAGISGAPGLAADYSPAASNLSAPSGLVVDAYGNLAFAESGNSRLTRLVACVAPYFNRPALPVCSYGEAIAQGSHAGGKAEEGLATAIPILAPNPVPAGSPLLLQLPASAKAVVLRLYDVNGSLRHEAQLDASGLLTAPAQPGLYLAMVEVQHRDRSPSRHLLKLAVIPGRKP